MLKLTHFDSNNQDGLELLRVEFGRGVDQARNFALGNSVGSWSSRKMPSAFVRAVFVDEPGCVLALESEEGGTPSGP